jgi:hypothetical protein
MRCWPSGQAAGRRRTYARQADALDLAAASAQQAGFFGGPGAGPPTTACARAGAPRWRRSPAPTCGERRTCWKLRPCPCARCPRVQLVDALAQKRISPRWPAAPEMQLNMVLLPAPLGPIRPSLRRHGRSGHVLVGHQAAELLAGVVTFEHQRPGLPGRRGRSRTPGAMAGATTSGSGRRWNFAHSRPPRPQAIARALQHEHHQHAEDHDLEVAALLPSSLGSQSCSHLEDGDHAGAPRTAPQTWPTPPTTAMNRYSMPCAGRRASGSRSAAGGHTASPRRSRRARRSGRSQSCTAAVLMPMASAMVLPPFRQRMARPSRESSRFWVASIGASRHSQIT